MYSTKNIENILIAASLNDKTQNQYTYYKDIDEIKEILFGGKFNQAIEAYNKGVIIYRGAKALAEYEALYVVPGTRRSQDTSNLYNKLISDILPSYLRIPKAPNLVALLSINQHGHFTSHSYNPEEFLSGCTTSSLTALVFTGSNSTVFGLPFCTPYPVRFCTGVQLPEASL